MISFVEVDCDIRINCEIYESLLLPIAYFQSLIFLEISRIISIFFLYKLFFLLRFRLIFISEWNNRSLQQIFLVRLKTKFWKEECTMIFTNLKRFSVNYFLENTSNPFSPNDLFQTYKKYSHLGRNRMAQVISNQKKSFAIAKERSFGIAMK